MSNNFPNIKSSKTVRIKNSNNNILKTLKTNDKKFNKKENILKKSGNKNLKKSNVSIINDTKYLNNSLIDFLSKKSNGFKPKISSKKNNIIRLNKKHNNIPSSNNITLDMDEIIAKRNNFNKRTNSSIIRNIKNNDFKRLNTHYENESKLNKDYSSNNNIKKSIRNFKKLQTTNYSEKKRKPRIKLTKDIETIKNTSNKNLEASNKKTSKKVNHIKNISSQNPEVLYNDKFNKQFTKNYVINKIKKEIKLSPSVKTRTNYNNFTTKTSKKIDFNDNASLNSSYFLKRKIKIIPMSHEYRERSLQNYNKKLKSELKDYKEYKEKYEEVVKENKKIQQKNNEITKRYIKLIQKLKEMKEKLQNNNNNNESEEKIDKKEKNKSRNNSAEKNRVTNNFTIQSQLNIFMTEPNLGEKESSNRIENEEIKKEKNDLKNEKNNNDKDIQEDKNKTEKKDKKILNDEEKKEVEEKKEEIRNILNIFRKKTVNIDNNKKSIDDDKKENDNSQKNDNKYLKMVLKDLLKSKAFNYRENLQKYFLRYYYNVFYLKRLEDKNKKQINEEKEENNINDENINENKNLNKHKHKRNNEVIRIEFKNRDLYTVEELKKVKRHKELRDLFYNKIKERQNYLHKCFTKFYYKGLMFYMKNKYSDKSKDTNKNNEKVNSNEKEKEKEKEIEAQKEEEEDKEKSKKNAQKFSNAITKARKLRMLLNQKNKEKLELMRKYFYKFHHAGIILALRKGTKRANLLKKIRGVDLETAFKDIINNKEINEIDIDENSNINDFKEALKKRVKTVKFAEDENKDEDKKDLDDIKISALEKLLYRADRNNKISLKNKLEIIFLKSKILSLGKYKRKKKKSKTIKKEKERSSVIEYDKGALSDGNYVQRSNTVDNKNKDDKDDDKEIEKDK